MKARVLKGIWRVSEFARVRARYLALGVFLLAWTCPAWAALVWDYEDVGSPSPAGSTNYSGGVYTVVGGGQWGGTSDSLHFAHQPIYGNFELIAKVTGFSNTTSGAGAGLMLRESLAANARQVSVVLTPSAGVKFYSRTTAGGANSTASGTASGAPRWLRLVRNGTALTGYESSGGAAWTQVGTATITMGNSVEVGLAAAACTATLERVALHVNLPQASDGDLKLWLRADAGVDTGSNQVWTDQSSAGHHAQQTTAANRPALIDNILNGRPVLRFDGSNDSLAADHDTNFNTSQVSLLTVFKRNLTDSGIIAWKMNSGGNQGYGQLYTSSTNLRSWINNNQANATPGTSSFVLAETIYNQVAHKVYLDGTQASSVSYSTAIASSSPEPFYVGSKGTSGYFNGDIAEVVVYNRALSDTDRTDLRAYLYSKYMVGSAPVLSTPVVTPSTGTFAEDQEVTISTPLGSRVYFTLDGSTPDQTKTLYTGPITVDDPTTLKARAYRVGYDPSAVATATYTFDPTVAALPRDNLEFWLRADSLTGSPVAAWEDQSGHGVNVAQATSGSRPTLQTGASGINNKPIVRFDGSDDFLQGDLPAAAAMQSAHHTIIALYKTGTTSNKKRILSLPYGTGSWNAPYASWALLAIGNNTYAGKAVSEIAYNTTTQSFAGATAASATGTAYLAAASFSGTNHKFYESGLLKENNAVTGSINYGAATVFNVGSRGIYNNGEYFQGDLAELFFFSEALTRAEQNKVEIYLAKKYALTIDSDQDGMRDDWEDENGLDPLANDASGNPDGDSLTNLQEYNGGVNSTDPFDYYNGTAPTLEIVQGDNQTGLPDAFAALTLRLKVKNGSTALVNAPVTFTVVGGGSNLAYTNSGSPTLYSSVTLRTDSNGIAVKDSGGVTRDLYVKLPASPGDLDVQVTVPGYSATATFDLTAVNPDTDNDGVIDSEEVTLGTDPNNADSDEDGINDGDEIAENTNPLDFNDYTPKRLAYFDFNAANWSGDRGQIPYSTNGISQVSSWSGNALNIDQPGGRHIKFKRIDTDGKPNVTAQRGSVRLWFKPDWGSDTGSGYWSRLFQMGGWTGDGSQGIWYLYLNANGQAMAYEVKDGNNHSTSVAASINWQPQEWHQIVVTYSSTGRKIYLDGVLAGQSSTAWSYLIDKADLDASGLMFGSDGSQPMKGDLDEVEIFNYELSATDIQNDYQSRSAESLDGDQVPDLWEWEQYGTLGHGDSFDPDGDGFSSLEEYENGTDPLTPTLEDTSGMLGWWKLDEESGTVAVDASGNGLHGQILGSPGHTIGADGSALDLNPQAVPHQGVLIPDSPLLDSLQKITVSAWIRPDNIASNRYYEIYRKEDGAQRVLLSFQEYGTILSFGINVGGVYGELDAPIQSSAYTDGNWHRVTATYDGSKKCIYMDGVLLASQSATGVLVTGGTAPAYIGSLNNSAEFFDGGLDDVRLYNRALGKREIYALAHPDGLVGQWDFDEGTGTVIADGTPPANHGALGANGPVFTPGINAGTALSFDGTGNDNAYLPDSANMDLLDFAGGDFSMSFWFKSNSSTYGRLVGNGAWWGVKGYAVALGKNAANQFGRLVVHLSSSQGSYPQATYPDALQLTSVEAFNDNLWHHVAVSVDRKNGKLRLYVDNQPREFESASSWGNGLVLTPGVPEADIAAMTDLDAAAGERLRFGQYQLTGDPYQGLLDEVKLFSRALDADAVAALYAPYSDGDLDGDGLPNGWEMQFGLNPSDDGSINPDNGAEGDPDEDGVGNYIEYLQGRNPVKGTVPAVAGTVDLVVFTELEN